MSASLSTAYPLSFGQQRLWFLDRVNPGSTEYLELVALRLAGRLDPVRLGQALDAVVARHEILRTRYVADGDIPMQQVDPPGAVPFRLVDLTAHPADEREERLDDLLAAEHSSPIDLATGPVLRPTLVRLRAEEHALVIAIHHIAFDGWSQMIMLEELWDHYAAGPGAAADPVAQYREYAAWQRDQMASGELGEQLDHWRRTLAGSAPLELRGDRVRPTTRDAVGGLYTFQVPADLMAQVRPLARRQMTTPFTVLLAAYNVLLMRYTQNTDVVVATPVAGRTNPDFERTIGFLTNTVPVRTVMSAASTFDDVVRLTREAALDAMSNQDVPFDQLVDQLNIERDLSRNPICQIAFVLQNTPEPAQPVGLRVESIAPRRRAARYDLTLELTAAADGSLVARVAYAVALYDEATVRRFAEHYLRLLDGLVAAPATPVTAVPMLTDTEADRIRAEWVTGSAVTEHDVPLPRLVERVAARTPDAVAVSFDGGELTYAELDRAANRLAHHLIDIGVGAETVVGICVRRGPGEATAALAVLKAGGAFLPLEHAHPDDRLVSVLADAHVSVLITELDFVDRFSPRMVFVVLDDPRDAALIDAAAEQAPDVPCHLANLAYVIYTSGSTGKPKGVAVPHAGLPGVVAHHRELLVIRPTDRVLRFSSPSFDASVFEIIMALGQGATLCYVDEAQLRPGESLPVALRRERISVAIIPPSCLSATQAADLPDLRILVVGGEACPASVAAEWGAGRTLFNLYGPTESTILATGTRCDPEAGRPPIGRPTHGLDVHLLDEHGNRVPVGVPGEIYIGGAGVVRGYLNRPGLTADRFPPDPLGSVPGARLYRTGDVARYRPDGQLEYLGRQDEQVKIRGYRIELREVAAVIAEHPQVRQAYALAHGDSLTQRQLLGYAVPVEGSGLDAAQLRAYLRRKVPEYLVPPHLFVLNTFPLTTAGKVDRNALPRPGHGGPSATTTREAPRTALEADLLAVWTRVLESVEISTEDSFFDIGGDSIRAVQVVGAMRERGFDVTVQDLFTHKSIADLAPVLAARPRLVRAEERVRPFAQISDEVRGRLPGTIVDAYPATQLQTGMLYEMLRGEFANSYHAVTSFYIDDDRAFSEAALRAAAQTVVRRHDALRTSFDLANHGAPLQLVHASADMPVSVVDLSHLSDAESEKRVKAFIYDQRDRQFDIARAPLASVVVHVIGPTSWRLSLIQCHAVLDGWSEHLVLREIVDAYVAARDGVEEDYEEPVVRFADFVPLERAAVDSGASRRFWAERVDGLEPFALPPPRREHAGEDVNHETWVEVADLVPALRDVAANVGVSMKALWHAAFLKALSAMTGQTRFSSGLVCNGRPEVRDGDRVVGLFLNTVPFTIPLAAPTWRALLLDVFAEHRAIGAHRRFPLAEIQAGWDGHGRLVDVLFNYVDFHVVDGTMVDLGRTLDLGQSEIAVDLNAVGDRLVLSGRPDRVDRTYCELLGRTLRRVLEAMVAEIDGDAQICLLSERDLDAVLAAGRGPRVAEPAGCLHELFARCVAQTPDGVAVDGAGGTLTFAALDARSNVLAHHLRALGVGVETPVAVRLPRGVDLIVAILATLKAGGVYVPVDPRLPSQRLRLILDNTRAPVMLTDGSVPSGDLPGVIRVSMSDVDLAGPPATSEPPPTDVGPDNAAYVIYTSGSTGTPNGVVVTHRGVANRVLDTVRRRGITPRDRVLLRSAIGFDASCWEIFVPLVASATIVVAPDDAEVDPAVVVETVHDGRVTVVQGVPAMLRQLADEPAWRRDNPVRLLYSGGDQLHADLGAHLLDGVGAELCNAYGPTECSIGITEGLFRPAASGDGHEAVAIGQPLANVDLVILGANGLPVPDGTVGELHVGGPALARGYLGRPGRTAERFVPDPILNPGGRLYRTGDLVRRRADGALEFVGRIDRQVKVFGARIEPEEVERTIVTHRAVHDAAVLVSGGRLVAYVSATAAVTSTDLREFLRDLLPEHCVPSAFCVLDHLPRTYAGKLDRAALPGAAVVDDVPERTPPRNAAERAVARVWCELLGVERVGVHDDFFQLGGHSLLIAQLASRLRAATGAGIPLREFFAAFTVEAQARLVATHRVDTAPLTPRERGEDAPLSFGQQRLWFLDRLEPGSPEYAVPLAIQIPPTATEEQVARALAALAMRHEILRTRYVDNDGEPRQIVDGAPAVDLRVFEAGSADLRVLVRNEYARGFDLARGPVWRAVLIRRVDGQQTVLLVLHHIACDGWSTGILRRDLTEQIAAILDARPPALPALPVQYADFAAWQRERLRGDLLESELDFWRTTLRGITPLELPTDRPRPEVWAPRGDIVTFTVPRDVGRRVLDIGRDRGATPFMTLLAVFVALLRRYSGERDLAIGTPVAGRVRAEVDDVVGFFVNTLVLRCGLSGDPTFRGLLDLVRDVAVAAFAHQELPFERIVDELQPERDMSRTPLVQVMFEVQGIEDASTEAEHDINQAVIDEWTVAKFDLTLFVSEQADGSLNGVLEYATALFDKATVRRFAEHYLRLLENVARDPDAPVAAHDLLAPAERFEVLNTWNDTARESSDDCVHELFERQARRTPDAIAVEAEDGRLTYAELDARANRLARHLRGLGVTVETPVGVRMERSVDLVTALLAVLKAGGHYVPVETEYPAARVAQILAAASARLCLVDVGQSVVVGDAVPTVEVSPDILAAASPVGPPAGTVSPDNLVAVYFTSGSTGQPKGVACTHRGWVNRLVAMQDELGLRPGEAVLQKTTIVFDDTPVECFWPLMVGGRVAILPPGAHRDPTAILDAIERHRAAAMLVVPTMLRLLLDAIDPPRRARLTSLRHVGTSGEALDPDLVRRFRGRFGPDGPTLHNHWGVTEAAIDSTHHVCTEADATGVGAVTIGRPIANNRVYVLDEDLQPVPVGVPGELYVGGLGIGRGYLREPGLTAQAFRPDPFDPGRRLYRTGDRAVLRPDATIGFLGRIDRQLKVRGVRVEPGEVEAALRGHPGVGDAAVVAWASPSGEQALAGYYTQRDGATPGPADLSEYLQIELPGYMVPAVLIAMAQLPRTASGKMDYRALPEPDVAESVAAQGLVAPSDATEERLVEIWAELLGVEVGVHNNFFHVGGHSLLAARVISRVADDFGVDLSLRVLFEKPTIAALAAVIKDEVRSEVMRLTDAQLQAESTGQEEPWT